MFRRVFEVFGQSRLRLQQYSRTTILYLEVSNGQPVSVRKSSRFAPIVDVVYLVATYLIMVSCLDNDHWHTLLSCPLRVTFDV